jgi:hypothetical protein
MRRLIPLQKLKARLMVDAKVRAEYEALSRYNWPGLQPVALRRRLSLIDEKLKRINSA